MKETVNEVFRGSSQHETGPHPATPGSCLWTSVWRVEVEQLALWWGQNNLELYTMEMSPPSPSALCLQWKPSGFTDLQSPKVGVQHRHRHLKRLSTWCTSCSSSGSWICLKSCWSSTTLQSSCSLFIHHCLIWIGHQTEQEWTTTDSQDCKLPSI